MLLGLRGTKYCGDCLCLFACLIFTDFCACYKRSWHCDMLYACLNMMTGNWLWHKGVYWKWLDRGQHRFDTVTYSDWLTRAPVQGGLWYLRLPCLLCGLWCSLLLDIFIFGYCIISTLLLLLLCCDDNLWLAVSSSMYVTAQGQLRHANH